MKTYFYQTINVLFSQESSFYFYYLERNSVCSKLNRGIDFFFQVELEVKSSSNEKKIVCRNSIPNPEALIDEMTDKTSKKMTVIKKT